MIMRYEILSQHATVFRYCTGLRVNEFDELWRDVQPLYEAGEERRLYKADRQRAIGGGQTPKLDQRDQVLMGVVWLRIYPTNEVLGYLFGVSDSSASRVIDRVIPILEQAGKDTMRMPDPGRKHRRTLSELVAEIPELVVVVDSFEQRVQRPINKEDRDSYYSFKKRAHTLKSQVAVDEVSGHIVDTAPSVRGRTHDLTLLKHSGLLERLPDDLGCIGDAAYQGIHDLHPNSFASRKKPWGKPRPPEDVQYNRAFSQRRTIVENTIGQLRRYQSLAQTDRHHRLSHSARVNAVAGLVNRQIDRRFIH